jgi:ABC-type branched-subunit amino acid transport system substrate-binding protein
VWFANPGGSLVLKNARQLNLKVPMAGPVSMDSAATVNIAGPAADGFVLAAQIAGGESLDRQKAFTAAYAKAYPETPSPNSLEAVGYDLIKIIAAAVKTIEPPYGYDLIKIIAAAVKTIEPPYTREKIRDALARLNYEGAGTIVHYSDTKNDPTPDTIVLTQITGGKFLLAR